MSVFSALRDTINCTEAFGTADITGKQMQYAIDEWFGLYYNPQKTREEDPCMQIPYTIVRKLTKTVFSEFETQTDDTFAQSVLESLETVREEAVQKALIGGECLMKPIPNGTGWKWVVVARNDMMILGRGVDGTITDIGTVEVTTQDKWTYTLLERRTQENGFLRIQNKLFRSNSGRTLGARVPLGTLPQYAELPEDYTYPVKLESVGLVPVRCPAENNVDGSKDGVSVYSAAVGLVHNINSNEAQLNGEFDRGKSRVFVSDDLLARDETGNKKKLQDTVFVALDGGTKEAGMTIFSPALRDESYERRKQGYLRAVESIIGLKRGLLSEVEAVERTAKEITSSEGDYNLTVIDFQRMWSAAVKEAMRICGMLGKLYNVAGAHEVKQDDYSLNYGDGVLYNPDKEDEIQFRLVQTGLLKPEKYLAWRFGLPSDTEEDLKKIRKTYMPEAEESE